MRYYDSIRGNTSISLRRHRHPTARYMLALPPPPPPVEVLQRGAQPALQTQGRPREVRPRHCFPRPSLRVPSSAVAATSCFQMLCARSEEHTSELQSQSNLV